MQPHFTRRARRTALAQTAGADQTRCAAEEQGLSDTEPPLASAGLLLHDEGPPGPSIGDPHSVVRDVIPEAAAGRFGRSLINRAGALPGIAVQTARTIARTANPLTLLIAMSSFGLIMGRDIVLARNLPDVWTIDVLFVALTLPMVVEQMFGIALKDALIPHLQQLRSQDQTGAYQREVGRIGNRVLLLGLLATSGVALFPVFWLNLLAPGLNAAYIETASRLMTLGAMSLTLIAWTYFQTGVLNTEGILVAPLWRAVLYNLGGIIAVCLRPDRPESLLVGVIVGQLVHVVWMQTLLGWRGLSAGQWTPTPQETLPAGSGNLTDALVPLLGTTIALQSSTVAERIFASSLGDGSIAHLAFSYRMTCAPVTLLSFSVLTFLYPRMVNASLDRNPAELNLLVSRGVRAMLYVLIPAALLLAAFAEPVLRTLFHSRSFDDHNVLETTRTLQTYVIGLPAMGLALLGGRVLVAVRQTWQLLAISVTVSVMTVLFDFAFSRWWGTVGLAAGAASGMTLQTLAIWYWIRRVSPVSLNLRPLVFAAVAAVPAGMVVRLWPWTTLPGLLAAGLVVMGLFLAVVVSLERWAIARS